ncbi:sporulation histidine kinase inhibitor Sda [Amphibacillus sediminis]|nr:sporulation histidine kinase inhibitor Sda [Amphibacillus sediminis]
MHHLTDEQLLEAYYTAIALKLDRDFILLLKAEIVFRRLKTAF